MTADEVSSFELKRIALDKWVDKILLPQPDAAKRGEPLASQEPTNQLSRIKDKKKMELLSVESRTLTNEFRREIDSAARRIHTLIAKSGRQGLDVDIIQESFSFENSLLLEALRKLVRLPSGTRQDNRLSINNLALQYQALGKSGARISKELQN
jgi:hypothetical protein